MRTDEQILEQIEKAMKELTSPPYSVLLMAIVELLMDVREVLLKKN